MHEFHPTPAFKVLTVDIKFKYIHIKASYQTGVSTQNDHLIKRYQTDFFTMDCAQQFRFKRKTSLSQTEME